MNKGFTLIEFLVVVATFSLLSSIVLVDVSSTLKKARDARRLTDMQNIQNALEMYKSNYGYYPENTDNDYSGWDTGYNGGLTGGDIFIDPLNPVYIIKTPGDPITTAYNSGYSYYRYAAGLYGCDASRGAFYILGIRNLEATNGAYPTSPGWSCPSRNWQREFEWVTGSFSK